MNKFIKSYGKYIVILFLIIVAGNVLLYFTYQHLKKEMIDGLNARQMIHAKQAAKGIEIFFSDHINTLQSFSKNEHIATFDESGKRLMREFLLSHVGEISIIARMDTKGRILHSEPYDRKVIGQPVSKMEYFLKVKRANQITVSDVFTNRRGFKSVIIHAPVIKNGHFDGTLSSLLSFNFIANRYIEDIRIGKDGYAWMVSSNGTELSCPISAHVGNSVFDNSRAFPDILAMAQRLVKGEQGVATYIDDRIRENVTRKTIIHSVFMPVHFGDNFWSIVVSTPEDEVTGVLSAFRNRLALIAILLLIGIGFFFYMLIKTSIVVKESELRRKSEEDLIQITARLSLAARAGGVGIWDYDTVNNILIWDEQMYRLYGITADQFSGAYESWRAGLHPDDMRQGDAEIQSALRGEKDFDTVFRVVWPDGFIRTIRALAIVQRDETGKPLRMIGTNWDITAQKQAEEALRESAEKHRQLIENSHDIIYSLTAGGIFTFVSPAWTVLLGHPVTSVAGHPFQEFVHPDDIPGCMVWLQKVIETGKRQEGVEYRARHIDGTWCWHTSSAVPLLDETGTIIGFEGTARDITERRRAEEESRRLSSIVLHSRELMNLTAPDGTMIFLNDAGKNMLGISEEEVAQTTIMQVIPEHLLDKVKQEVLPAIVRDGYWEGELQYRNVKTGGLTDVHATTFRIADPATGVVQFLANVSLDITDRKRAEEAMSAKNKEMENYLYIASHDLRSPLVNIQGFSQRLQKQADAIKTALADCALPLATKAGIDVITDEGIPKTLNFIFSNVTKMDVLLNGLLHLSRTGRAVMAIKEIDINQLFQTIIANFNFQLTQLDAIITAKDIPSCYGDENLLNQLFSNIIGNAIKYHDKNRRLVIEITARKEFRKVIYSIRDTGLGMEERHLERIWDIFYRVDPTLTDTGEGLGLSSSKRIAEKHHGRVWAESEAGKGSVFYVELQTTEFSEFQ